MHGRGRERVAMDAAPLAPTRRLGAALGLSIACHAVLAVALGFVVQAERRAAPDLVVSIVARGGEPASGGGPAAAAPEPAPVAAVAVAVAPVKPAAPHAPRVVRRAPAVRAPNAESAQPAEVAAVDLGAGPGGAGSGIAMGSGGGAGTGGTGGDGLRAFCRSCPTPSYPSRARRQGWQGTVDVELRIGSDGAVEQANVGRSSGYPVLDDTALAVARASRFAVPDGGEGLRGQLRYRFVLDATAERGAP